jgi:hypothetical protein
MDPVPAASGFLQMPRSPSQHNMKKSVLITVNRPGGQMF